MEFVMNKNKLGVCFMFVSAVSFGVFLWNADTADLYKTAMVIGMMTVAMVCLKADLWIKKQKENKRLEARVRREEMLRTLPQLTIGVFLQIVEIDLGWVKDQEIFLPDEDFADMELIGHTFCSILDHCNLDPRKLSECLVEKYDERTTEDFLIGMTSGSKNPEIMLSIEEIRKTCASIIAEKHRLSVISAGLKAAGVKKPQTLI